MPRRSRRRMIGKWARVEQEQREAALAALQRELRAAWRRLRSRQRPADDETSQLGPEVPPDA